MFKNRKGLMKLTGGIIAIFVASYILGYMLTMSLVHMRF